MELAIPQKWLQSRRQLFGADVFDAWLEEAKQTALHFADEWQLEVKGFLTGGALSMPLECQRSDGSLAVLKISAPWNQAPYGAECAALQAWRGQGAVRLLEANPTGNVILLEMLAPGSPMSHQIDDLSACQQIAKLYQQLSDAQPVSGLPDAIEQTKSHLRLARISWRSKQLDNIISSQHFLAFEEFVTAWCQGGEHRITHGDFQNKNILLRDKELVVIDPAPAISDPLMDLANWLLIFNPQRGVERRAKILSELLGLDPERLMVWVRIQATYSAIFSTPHQRADYLKYHLPLREL